MRKRLLLLALSLGFIFTLCVTAVPAAAQNYSPTGACGVGRYWLIHDNGWDGVLLRQGDSNTFEGFGAFWMQPDGTATFTIDIQGDAVTMERVDDPNIFGTTSCTYQGTVRPDGNSVVGTTTCQVQGVTSPALSWTAVILCDVPVITWNDTVFWHRAAKGFQFTFECPFDGFRAPVWGTDIYIEGSSICAAGVHAGVITLENGGYVTVEILPGEPFYQGSTRNGITSETFPTPGQFNASFRVVGGQVSNPPTPIMKPTITPTMDATTAARWANFMGTWNTSYGVMTLDSSGVATYPGPDPTVGQSHVYFQQDDAYTISGYWVQLSSSVNCGVERYGSNYWGRMRWTFDENYARFDGVWSYCDEEPTAYWGGQRQP
jgi:hypothetical protein